MAARSTARASRRASAPCGTARETRSARRAPGEDRRARRVRARRASSSGEPQGRCQAALVAGSGIEVPHEEQRRALIDPLEATLGERYGLDRTPAELGRRAPLQLSLHGRPLVDHRHRYAAGLVVCAAEFWAFSEIEI